MNSIDYSEIIFEAIKIMPCLYCFYLFARWVKRRFPVNGYVSNEEMLRNKIDALFDDIDEYKLQLRNRDDKLKNLNYELTDVSVKLGKSEQEVQELKAELSAADEKITILEGQLKYMKHLYETEQSNNVELLKKYEEEIKVNKALSKNCDATQALNRQLENRIDELVGEQIKLDVGVAI